MAALNLAHELLRIRSQGEVSGNAGQRVRQMRERVEAALSKSQQLDL
jgi:cell division protein ZapA (FtsZ GTPase activity inhibitor)